MRTTPRKSRKAAERVVFSCELDCTGIMIFVLLDCSMFRSDHFDEFLAKNEPKMKILIFHVFLEFKISYTIRPKWNLISS